MAAVAALWVAGWFDGSVLIDVQRRSGASFDPNEFMLAIAVGSLAVAGCVLMLGVVAWRSCSTLVGATYILVGSFFAFLPVIVWRFAAEINGNPPVLPVQIANAVSHVYTWSNGPLYAVEIVGSGMSMVGVAVIWRSLRDRSTDTTNEFPNRAVADDLAPTEASGGDA